METELTGTVSQNIKLNINVMLLARKRYKKDYKMSKYINHK